MLRTICPRTKLIRMLPFETGKDRKPMTGKQLLTVAVMTLFLGSCVQDSGPKEGMGTLIGAGLGALAGSQIGDGKGQLAAVAIGALAGAYIGKEIGKSLDKADRLEMQNATQKALEKSPSGKVTEWKNPDSGHAGTITPQPAFETAQGSTCREYQQTVTVAGETATGYGTACRQPDGSWHIVAKD